jgi:transposase
MPRAIAVPIRRVIVERHQAGQSLESIALALGLTHDTVRNIWRRFRDRGEAGLIPDHH